MQTDKWYWVPWVVAILGGGAMGAVITAYIANRKNKRQPVEYTKEIIDIVRKKEDFPKYAKLVMTEHPLGFGEEKSVENLSLVRISIKNKGNQDINEYNFGITLEGENKAVDVRFKGTDRHHKITMGIPGFAINEGPKEPVTEIDFTMTPFNRGDTYDVDIYFSYEGSRGEVTLSSPDATVLVPAGPSSPAVALVISGSKQVWMFMIIMIVLLLGLLFGLYGLTKQAKDLRSRMIQEQPSSSPPSQIR